jgi:hypothetical protein
MPEDFRYETALAAALGIIHTLSVRPELPRPQRLATATYAILGAIRQVEERLVASGSPLPAPAVPGDVAVRCRLLPAGQLTDARGGGRQHDSIALPYP